MFLTQPGTDSLVWIPSTESQASKVKSGLDIGERISSLVILGLVVFALSAVLGRFTSFPVLIVPIVGGVIVAGLLALTIKSRVSAVQRLNQMYEEYRALSVDSLLYKLLAAQLLIKSGRNLGELLNDPDDGKLYESIVIDSVRAPETQAVLKEYVTATESNDRTVLMAVHAALVTKTDGVVEDLIGAYRAQHQ